jgi:hypothetical protein
MFYVLLCVIISWNLQSYIISEFLICTCVVRIHFYMVFDKLDCILEYNPQDPFLYGN